MKKEMAKTAAFKSSFFWFELKTDMSTAAFVWFAVLVRMLARYSKNMRIYVNKLKPVEKTIMQLGMIENMNGNISFDDQLPLQTRRPRPKVIPVSIVLVYNGYVTNEIEAIQIDKTQ